MPGIISYGAYLPHYRLRRDAIAATLGTGQGCGTRAVASYDEDSTSMGVEAARRALNAAPFVGRGVDLLFATTRPAYLDKTNATAIHAALGLDESAGAYDVLGAARSAAGALRLASAAGTPTLAVMSDLRVGLPASAEESTGGDGAVAFVLGSGETVIAELVAHAASSAEFLDRWRDPGEATGRSWEERFGETAYVPLASRAIADALKAADITADDIAHLVVAGLHARAVRRVSATIAAGAASNTGPHLLGSLGNTGAAQLGLELAAALDQAAAGQHVLAVSLADGADAFVYRTTAAIDEFRPGTTVDDLIASGDESLMYSTYLSWRGQLRREPPRRPDPEPPAAPPAFRAEDWKFAFVGSRCERCGTRHLPPQRVCVSCSAQDRMLPESLADTRATVATYAVDRLAFSLNPPVVIAVVDFDGGGRYQCEMTDVDPSTVNIGDRVTMTFRRLFTASDGIHNYFWKACPERTR